MLNWGPNGAWLIGRLGWIAVVGAVGYGGAQMVRYYLGVDAFADLRPRNDGVADEVAMQFEDVELRHYKAGKLSMSASADRLEMSKNRATFTMEGIDDGKLTGPKGSTMGSSRDPRARRGSRRIAPTGTWRSSSSL